MNGNRYLRQTVLSEFGAEAQEKLAASRVLVVGLGGLGLPAAQYLNAMGVGTLGLVEHDLVELTNLQRQVLYTENDVGRPKLDVAFNFLKAQNSGTQIYRYDCFLDRENALGIIEDFDLVIDATDNFPVRYLINDSCVILKKPFVYGALHGFEGQVAVFNYNGGPTYRCVYPEMPGPLEIPDCNQNGVLGVIPGIIGTLQALEAVKAITGIGEALSGKLLIYNGIDHMVRKIGIPMKPENLRITQLASHYGLPGCSKGREVTIDTLLEKKKEGGDIYLVDVRDVHEFQEYHIKGSLNIPLPVLEEALEEMDPGKPMYLLCATGKRSQIAQQIILDNHPDREVYNIEGGIGNYKALAHE